MLCPSCSRTAVSFPRFLRSFYPRRFRCQNCGAHLEWTPYWKHIYNWSFVGAFVVAVLLGMLRRLLGIGRLEFVIAFLILAVLFAIIFWKKSAYLVATS